MFEDARARIEALRKPSPESEETTMTKNGTKGGPKKRAAKKLPPGVPDGANTFERHLPVPLDDAEMRAKGKLAAKLDDECDELSEKLKTVGKGLRGDLKMKRGQIRGLHKDITAGTEDRPVLCYERKDFNAGLVRVVRTDTGEEVESRVMDGSERQEALPMPKRTSRGGKAVNGAVEPTGDGPDDEVDVEGAEA
jgi:hypothetical protein